MSEQMSQAEIEEYLALANEDLTAAQDNLRFGHLRAAVSRAYYAMFYPSTALLGSKGLWRSKHQGLIAAFGEHFVKTGLIEPQYGRILHDAFEARLDSDYGLNPDLTEASAQQLISNATSFVERLAQSLQPDQGDEAEHDTDEHLG
jgi:uncharacterized protein (UPF0332 family)